MSEMTHTITVQSAYIIVVQFTYASLVLLGGNCQIEGRVDPGRPQTPNQSMNDNAVNLYVTLKSEFCWKNYVWLQGDRATLTLVRISQVYFIIMFMTRACRTDIMGVS